MIIYTTSKDENDLLGILTLQKKNLAKNLTGEEIVSQGFVTVSHQLEDLQKMNIPVLIPMFEAFEKIKFLGGTLADYNYIVVGQVCVDKNYRGQGTLDKCYALYTERFKDKYDFAVTEIASSNLRSINAHKRIGFEKIHEYVAPNAEKWSIVVLNWKSM